MRLPAGPLILAVALLAAAAAGQQTVEPGPDCAGGAADGGWAPVDATGADGLLPTLANATLAAFLEQVNATVAGCAAEELEVSSLEGCAQALGDEQQLALWANLSCPGAFEDAAGVRAVFKLPLPLGPDWAAGLASATEVEVLFGEPAAAATGGLVQLPDPQLMRAEGGATGAPRESPLPPGPGWEKSPQFVGEGQWESYSVEQQLKNQGVVADFNASGTFLDFLLYGDSITRYLQRDGDQWHEYFSGDNGWGETHALGVAGNDVADLMWRLVAGGEVPAVDPKAVAVLAGINDLTANNSVEQTTDRMRFLLTWLQTAMPDTRLLLLGLLPNLLADVTEQNAAYEALAAELGVPFVYCGDGIDVAALQDGVHPVGDNQRVILDCLEPAARAVAFWQD